jgi:hypothetical protein
MNMWMLTQLGMGKAKPELPRTMATEGPPGSETVARHQSRVGNSGDPLNSSVRESGGTTGQPGGSPMIQGKSDVLIVVSNWGNAQGAKGGTCGRTLDGNVIHTQR